MPASIPRVGPAEAHALVRDEGHAYVDVRAVSEFEAGHPEGAYNVPLAFEGGAPNPRFLAAIERAFGKDRPLVLGCQTGVRSLRAAAVLAREGFSRVVDQRAGWAGARDPFGRVLEPGWQRADLPSSVQAAPGRSWAELDPHEETI